jgi:hypothetical protein
VRYALDEARLRAFCPGLAADDFAPHLHAIDAVMRGDPAGGALAELDQSDRFGWVAARSSTVIQATEVHTGITEDPAATLDRLFEALVACP